MSSRSSALAAVLALSAWPGMAPAGPAPITVINGATIIHPSRQGAAAVEPGATIVISGDRIQLASSGITLELPQGAKIIDARGKWVIPGLVDAHVHFFQSGNLYTRPDVADFNAIVPYAQEVARNKARLDATFKVWLASGVTGVVDIGGPFWNFDVRDRSVLSRAAPRMAVAGPLISMIARPQLDLGDPPIVKIDSPEAARAFVARQLDREPDYIKVWFIHQEGDDLAAQEAIVKAAGDAAHAAGKRLAVHATELVVAKAALRAGADYLVHGVYDVPVDEEFLRLARKNNALLCPTLFVMDGYALALGNTWKATEAEAARADPQILAAMDDLNEIPKEKLPPLRRHPDGEAARARVERRRDEGPAPDRGCARGRRDGHGCRQHRHAPRALDPPRDETDGGRRADAARGAARRDRERREGARPRGRGGRSQGRHARGPRDPRRRPARGHRQPFEGVPDDQGRGGVRPGGADGVDPLTPRRASFAPPSPASPSWSRSRSRRRAFPSRRAASSARFSAPSCFGVLWRNAVGIGGWADAGVELAGRLLLRAGIALIGLGSLSSC